MGCYTRTPGIVARAYRTYRKSGTGVNNIQNSQKYRVRVRMAILENFQNFFVRVGGYGPVCTLQ